MQSGSVGLNDCLGTLSNQRHPGHNQTTGTTKKTYCFAILAIVGFGGLVVGIVGLVQAIQAGALTSQAIIMMATGGVGGTLFLIIGIVGLAKNRQRASHQLENRDTNHQLENRNTNISVQPNCVRQTAFIERTAVGSIRDMQRFGKVEWELYFGVVPDEPPLDNIDEILNAPCPFSGDDTIKVKDTHMLVLIPATVGGEALNLNRLSQLIRHPNNNGHVTNYEHYANDVSTAHGATESGRSYWVLMTRDVIPESRTKTYNEQKELIRQQGHGNYTLPGALEAAVCILMEHVVSGNKLFGTKPLTYIRCSEIVYERYPVIVGGFGSDGLVVYHFSSFFASDFYGAGALRKCF